MREALDQARRICQRSGRRLTPLRARVLALLWQSHRPLGAYEILDLLDRERQGPAPRATPASVYRSLDFLREHGLVHRIECLNAYIGCSNPDPFHVGQFFICRCCGQAQEASNPAIGRELQSAARAAGFTIQDWSLEVAGLCPACRQAGDG